jgi:hypothetical protein
VVDDDRLLGDVTLGGEGDSAAAGDWAFGA